MPTSVHSVRSMLVCISPTPSDITIVFAVIILLCIGTNRITQYPGTYIQLYAYPGTRVVDSPQVLSVFCCTPCSPALPNPSISSPCWEALHYFILPVQLCLWCCGPVLFRCLFDQKCFKLPMLRSSIDATHTGSDQSYPLPLTRPASKSLPS